MFSRKITQNRVNDYEQGALFCACRDFYEIECLLIEFSFFGGKFIGVNPAILLKNERGSNKPSPAKAQMDQEKERRRKK